MQSRVADRIYTLVLAIECRIAHAHSLKQKRAVVRGLTGRLRARLNASVAEVGRLDEWQYALIGVGMLSNSRRYLQQQQAVVEQQLLELTDIEIIRIDSHWL